MKYLSRLLVKFQAPWPVVLILLTVSFGYGGAVVQYRLPPLFEGLQTARNLFVDIVGLNAPLDEPLLSDAFTKPLPSIDEFLYRPALSISDLTAQIEEMKVVSAERYFEVYSSLHVVDSPKPVAKKILELNYQVGDDQPAKAYTYFLPSERRDGTCGILLIPGSGDNQALAISRGEGYHGPIAKSLIAHCDVFILIKPNHGYRSIHNGNHRLDADYWVYSGLLNSGNSYAATYLTEGMAWAKYLSSSQELWGVAGLSQGGEAAFLVSLQSDPVFAIISSGFSVYRAESFRAQSDQIIIPGRFEHYDTATLHQIISASEVRYLLSYGGESDSPEMIKESRTHRTCTFLELIAGERVTCVFHNGGHEFPIKDIDAFLTEMAFLNEG